MDEHIFIDEYPVGDGGYELGEAIDDTIYVDNIDHSADFLNPPYLDEWAAFDYDFTGPKEDIEKMKPSEPVYDISWIRKRMKCCKNPMERTQLKKQLNVAYKARKKARKKK